MDYNLNSVIQVGDTMLGFGLALTIILYAVLIFSVGFYFGSEGLFNCSEFKCLIIFTFEQTLYKMIMIK